jgi:hypothetical protein
MQRSWYLLFGAVLVAGCVSDDPPVSVRGGDGGSSLDAGLGDGAPTPIRYAVGGIVKGLTGGGLSLSNNGETLAITATPGQDVKFSFANRLETGNTYDVKVATTPDAPKQVCLLTGGAGTVGTSDITNVAVTCATGRGLSVNVTGMNGGWLNLTNTVAGVTETKAVIKDGIVALNSVASGSTYALSTGPGLYTCSFSSPTGMVGASDVMVDAACLPVVNAQQSAIVGEEITPVAVAGSVGLAWTGTDYWFARRVIGNPANTLMVFSSAYAPVRSNLTTNPTGYYFNSISILNNLPVVSSLAGGLSARLFYANFPSGTTVALPAAFSMSVCEYCNVVANRAGTTLYTRQGTIIDRWSVSGSVAMPSSPITLNGTPGSSIKANSHLAIAGPVGAEVLLTFSLSKILDAWRLDGSHLASMILTGAGTSEDAAASFSFARVRLWTLDESASKWIAYDIGTP